MYVRKAVNVASFVARLRVRHYPDLSEKERSNPHLMLAGNEPWKPQKSMGSTIGKADFSSRLYQSGVFDSREMTVTEEDWRVACALTPDLPDRPEFGIGKVWKISPHQLRRTTSVNLFSSEMVSLPSLQWAMKHMSRDMTLYYTRNYTNLRLNSGAERAVIMERYKSIYRQMAEIVRDAERHVKPHGREMLSDKVVNLIESREEDKLLKLIKKGQVGCRKTRLGFCMKAGACGYGGIDSIAHCAGYDGKGICADARFDRKREPELRAMKESHKKELETLSADSPRSNHLKAEVYAIEVYLDAIQGQAS
jgi:hypothetical protein